MGGAQQRRDAERQSRANPHLPTARLRQWTTIRTLTEALTRRLADEPAVTLYNALAASASAQPLIGGDGRRIEQAVGTLKTRLGEQRYNELLAAGAALGDEAAITYARRYTAARAAPPDETTSTFELRGVS